MIFTESHPPRNSRSDCNCVVHDPMVLVVSFSVCFIFASRSLDSLSIIPVFRRCVFADVWRLGTTFGPRNPLPDGCQCLLLTRLHMVLSYSCFSSSATQAFNSHCDSFFPWRFLLLLLFGSLLPFPMTQTFKLVDVRY